MDVSLRPGEEGNIEESTIHGEENKKIRSASWIDFRRSIPSSSVDKCKKRKKKKKKKKKKRGKASDDAIDRIADAIVVHVTALDAAEELGFSTGLFASVDRQGPLMMRTLLHPPSLQKSAIREVQVLRRITITVMQLCGSLCHSGSERRAFYDRRNPFWRNMRGCGNCRCSGIPHAQRKNLDSLS